MSKDSISIETESEINLAIPKTAIISLDEDLSSNEDFKSPINLITEDSPLASPLKGPAEE